MNERLNGADTMFLEGRIVDGAVVFDQPVSLPDGTRVRVEPLTSGESTGAGSRSLLSALGDVVGVIDDLPDDFSRQHDHYLYGAAKRP